MNLLLITSIFISPIVGVCTGWAVGFFMRSPRLMRISRVISQFLAVLAWIIYVGALINWHYSVASRLDGSEGAGVGFGRVMVYFGGAALGFLFSGIAFGLRLHKRL